MIRVFVTGMLAGMGLYSEVQKAKLEAALKEAKKENKRLRNQIYISARDGNASIGLGPRRIG